MNCIKCCQRPAWHLSDGRLAFQSPRARGVAPADSAGRVDAPPGMLEAYADMVSRVPDLGQPPSLEFYDDLHGVGGLFIADAWTIAIGIRDIEDITTVVLSEHFAEVAQITNELSPGRGDSPATVWSVMKAAGMGRCVAHELGHAVIFRGWSNPFAPDQEAGADYYAGRFDAARGADWRLGEMFFHAIGCVGTSCRHPSPDGRSHAYIRGYRQQSPRAA